MSILDDAIREHLDLKRRHGADESELKRLEDEAFGPPGRPEEGLDPYSEAPTEFLASPGAEAGEPAPELDFDEEDSGGRRVDVADLQEPPPPPAEEEHPAMEHEAVTELPAAEPEPAAEEPAAAAGAAEPEGDPDADERHAIAEQPTEVFDVEGNFDAAGEAATPSDEQLAEAELGEPRLAPVDPVEGIEASAAEAPPSDEELEQHADEFDEFFSEQRLSDELNQALEAPLEDEPGFPATEEAEESAAAPAEEPGPDPGEGDAGASPAAADEPEEEDAGEEHPAAHHEADHQDALEDTPDFLADDPDDDSLWFEQKPPKDIDFGD